MNMNQKAQGAIEYLLLLAAAIVIVAIVIVAMTGGLSQAQDQGKQANNDKNTQMTKLNCVKDCNYYGSCSTDQIGCGKYSDICKASPNSTCLKR